ncbi:ABC transporter substrate-binding protein [Ramlibacter sp. USB13]|uniref:ABC transporter substrate-binding protein n=1 Tax=Ramlibacter cellulosilyticus TaxID=2764187 RepID=A0A923MRN2_9BURK|nr:ABC transporter substrate-binding protein [Ramlibacter cellulosilyticus]MBC5783344.1 ABC transporter substrate-binding protein [Ramlibacter cellulosilyticus]
MPLPLRRRSLLAATAAALAFPAFAQSARSSPRPLVVAQMHDVSAAEQDVTRDFLVGARAAWQDINAHGGVRGRPVQHLALEVEGSKAGVQDAWQALRENPACVALSGTVSDAVSMELAAALREEDAGISHAAPWLQNGSIAADERTFPIFSGRQEQIAHALRSLTVSGMRDVGAVFASARASRLYAGDVQRAAQAAQLKLSSFVAEGDLARLGRRLGPDTPAVLLFLGGTPELVQFTQGLDRQARQRYVVALADVNLQVVQQAGAARTTPVIATQSVPLVTAAIPVVRRYREVLARLFDEPPTALSLAGFIAARYTFEVLAGIEGPVTRASALAAFQKREDRDVGGYWVRYQGQRRSASFVTQSMLTPDGRVVG